MGYEEWWDAGFRDVISITPPDAELSPQSKLDAKDRGKVPGRLNASGTWGGYDWLRHEATRKECVRWHNSGANLGLRTASFPALDLDILDLDTVKGLVALAHEELGWAPERVGRAPKRLMLYRTDAPFGRMRLELWREGEAFLIEFLGAGQQCVVEGIHPKTGKPYRWRQDPLDVGAEGLTTITVEDADRYLDEAAAWLQDRGWQTKRVGTAQEATDEEIWSPASLMAPLERVRAAVISLPNTNEAFPGRDDYLTVGTAIKAALIEHPDEAFALWWDWCQKWEGNERVSTNTIETAEADWERMRPPFRIGAPYLFDLAREHGWSNASQDFQDGAIPLEPMPERRMADRSGAVPYSDAWLASRFIAEFGDRIRYCGQLGGWLCWDGATWQKDDLNTARSLCGKSLRRAGREALDTITKKKEAEEMAWRCGQVNVLNAVMNYASYSPLVAMPVTLFDADLWALNTPDGIVDLTTGVMTKSDPARLCTRATAIAPDSSVKPTRWLRFIEESTGGDEELAKYLQRLAGYCLTGSVREHSLTFFYGPGGNGKGTFVKAMVEMMGGYSQVAAMDTFVSSRFDRHPTELAALFGARLVTAEETQEGRSWDDAKVKTLTGGNIISARFMRENLFRFQPQFTLVFAGNHLPRIANLDEAMRRRFHLVPFMVRPKEMDRELEDKLRQEYAGILAWAIEGCIAWQREGLKPPFAVRKATEVYFADEDPLGRWLSEMTEKKQGEGTMTRDLFSAWRIWCGDSNEKVGTERTFSQAMQQRGYERWLDPRTRRHGYAGIVLRPEPAGPSAAQLDFSIPLPPPKAKGERVLH